MIICDTPSESQSQVFFPTKSTLINGNIFSGKLMKIEVIDTIYSEKWF